VNDSHALFAFDEEAQHLKTKVSFKRSEQETEKAAPGSGFSSV
jgi:hypothetical protein